MGLAELGEQVDSINSREDFVAFVRALLDDLLKDPNDWENPTLESYLEHLAAWVDDMGGWYKNRGEVMPERPTWKLLGNILLAARLYE